MDVHIGYSHSHWLLMCSALTCTLQATSGLGAAAAYALSKEGYYVVLGTLSITCPARKSNSMNIENYNLYVV